MGTLNFGEGVARLDGRLEGKIIGGGKNVSTFHGEQGLTKLKCLLLPIHSQKDLEVDISYLIKTTLQEMKEGEVKTLSI